jgi:hypothetical protein
MTPLAHAKKLWRTIKISAARGLLNRPAPD